MPLARALERYDHVLLDLDGCPWAGDAPPHRAPPGAVRSRPARLALDGGLWVGAEPTHRAPEAVAALREAGTSVVFVTNDPQRTAEEFVRKLWRLGFRASVDEIASVGGAMQHVLA